MQFYDLATTTLGAGAAKPVELKIGLWESDGTNISYSSSYTQLGQAFVQDGSTAVSTSATLSSVQLHTLSAKWPATTKFALEATLYGFNISYAAEAALWDFTASSAVVASNVSVSVTTATTLRGGQFTLTPGHVYGVTVYNQGNTSYFVDASLIVFPN